MRFAILVDKKRDVRDMNQLENCQARYRSNTWMGRTRTDGPDEFEPTKFDCIWQGFIHKGIFSDVLSDKMAEWGMMRHQVLRSVHVFGKVLSIRVYFQMC